MPGHQLARGGEEHSVVSGHTRAAVTWPRFSSGVDYLHQNRTGELELGAV